MLLWWSRDTIHIAWENFLFHLFPRTREMGLFSKDLMKTLRKIYIYIYIISWNIFSFRRFPRLVWKTYEHGDVMVLFYLRTTTVLSYVNINYKKKHHSKIQKNSPHRKFFSPSEHKNHLTSQMKIYIDRYICLRN